MSGLEIILRDAEAIFKRARLDRLQGTNILVTGASGLIGTHILACLCHLSKCGISVQVYAHMLSQMPPHLTELVGEGRFKVLQDDLADFNSYLRLPEADVIIHAAGYAQPTRFMENPIAVLQINTSATISLLKRLRQNGSFLFLSSSEIYSGLKDVPAAETAIGTTTPFHPRASYIEGKRSGEAICYAFRLQGIRSVSARLGDVYGPGTRKHDTRVLNSFI
jgi:nucleoside-diphosphate-sugar epimerase